MLNADETQLLNEVLTALINHDETVLAKQLSNTLARSASTKAKIAKAAKSAAKGGRGGAPRLSFAVALEPGWQRQVQGARAAADLVKETLTEFGMGSLAPTPQSMGVQLSRAGRWWTTVETDNGTCTLTVTKSA